MQAAKFLQKESQSRHNAIGFLFLGNDGRSLTTHRQNITPKNLYKVTRFLLPCQGQIQTLTFKETSMAVNEAKLLCYREFNIYFYKNR